MLRWWRELVHNFQLGRAKARADKHIKRLNYEEEQQASWRERLSKGRKL